MKKRFKRQEHYRNESIRRINYTVPRLAMMEKKKLLGYSRQSINQEMFYKVQGHHSHLEEVD